MRTHSARAIIYYVVLNSRERCCLPTTLYLLGVVRNIVMNIRNFRRLLGFLTTLGYMGQA